MARGAVALTVSAIAWLAAMVPPALARAPTTRSGSPDRRVICAGADTMRGLVTAWGALAHGRYPRVAVRREVAGKLAADGFAALMAGRANCATFVRELFPSEVTAFRARFGYPPTLINVAGGSYATQGGTHAIAIYVNAANPLRRLDLVQLDAALSKSRNRGGRPVATWGDLGVGGDWAARPVRVYGMLARRPSGDPPGVVNYLMERVLQGGQFRDDLIEQTDRPGESALRAIVDRVAADQAGLGYSGFGYGRPGAKALAIGETANGPFVCGTPETVRDRRYPLSRRIYILVNRPPGQALDPALRAFLSTALSRRGQAAVAADPEGFLPLTRSDDMAATAEVSLNEKARR